MKKGAAEGESNSTKKKGESNATLPHGWSRKSQYTHFNTINSANAPHIFKEK